MRESIDRELFFAFLYYLQNQPTLEMRQEPWALVLADIRQILRRTATELIK
jgi:hypothetical protein